jgi:putative transposase
VGRPRPRHRPASAGAGLIHHSDRGVQYASAAYVQRLSAVGAQVSMSAESNPYDNAKAKSFFKTLKREEVYLKQYETFTDSEGQMGRFIDAGYNQKRLHSSLGYLPSVEYKSLYNAKEEHPSPVVQ